MNAEKLCWIVNTDEPVTNGVQVETDGGAIVNARKASTNTLKFVGAEITLVAPNITKVAAQHRIKMSWVHFLSNATIFQNKKIDIGQRIGFWSKTTRLSLQWASEV